MELETTQRPIITKKRKITALFAIAIEAKREREQRV
jgi:hypothetical protein